MTWIFVVQRARFSNFIIPLWLKSLWTQYLVRYRYQNVCYQSVCLYLLQRLSIKFAPPTVFRNELSWFNWINVDAGHIWVIEATGVCQGGTISHKHGHDADSKQQAGSLQPSSQTTAPREYAVFMNELNIISSVDEMYNLLIELSDKGIFLSNFIINFIDGSVFIFQVDYSWQIRIPDVKYRV